MRLIITGANGQVGREFEKTAGFPGLEIIPLARNELDITSRRQVEKTVEALAPGLVVNAAAYTAVDMAEKEPGKASAVNREGPLNLAEVCRARSVPLIHISTDYVFDGTSRIPYVEDDPASPLGVYGMSKWEGEQAVRNVLDEHIILRVSWVFGVHGSNFVKTMLRIGKERREVRVVYDQHGCPTPAADIAGVILSIAEQICSGRTDAWGTYHYSGLGETTWFHFAQKIFSMADSIVAFSLPVIIPIPSTEYPTPAKRPLNSVFDCSRIKAVFGIEQAPWEPGLEAVIRAWKSEE